MRLSTYGPVKPLGAGTARPRPHRPVKLLVAGTGLKTLRPVKRLGAGAARRNIHCPHTATTVVPGQVYAPWRDPILLEEFPGRSQMLAYLQSGAPRELVRRTAEDGWDTPGSPTMSMFRRLSTRALDHQKRPFWEASPGTTWASGGPQNAGINWGGPAMYGHPQTRMQAFPQSGAC